MPTVSNSSPIIHLTKIGLLGLLEDLFRQIVVPEKVFEECTHSDRHQDEAALIKNAEWIVVESISNTRVFNLLHSDVDAGEAEALVLALESNAELILLDDQEARFKARRMGLPITGTVGVLLLAKKKGLIESFSESIHQLQSKGFWISPTLLHQLLAVDHARLK